MSLDFREETPVGNRHLRVISIKKTFKAMEQCELAWLESIEEEDQLARTGASRGFPRAAAPVGVFSRGAFFNAS